MLELRFLDFCGFVGAATCERLASLVFLKCAHKDKSLPQADAVNLKIPCSALHHEIYAKVFQTKYGIAGNMIRDPKLRQKYILAQSALNQ